MMFRRSLLLAATILSVAAQPLSVQAQDAAAVSAPPSPAPVPQAPDGAPDAAPWQAARPARPPLYAGAEKHSLYVTMPDGVRIAVDYYLPQGMAPGARLPTLLQQTRYYRSIASIADPAGSCAHIGAMPRYFAERGYAFVVVDVRGTGASFGTRVNEFSDAEQADGSAILDWIAAQPWSNGRVGATGTSYVGTSAELLARRHHPALRAVAPISAGYDFYADLDFPGGVRNSFFVDNWGALNAALDTGQARRVPGLSNVAGPCPVDADADGTQLTEALRAHVANANSTESLRGVEFRDDAALAWPSPYPYQDAIDAAGIPLLSLASWNDSGYARSAINRFLTTRSALQRVIITPGNHGLGHYYAPGVTAPIRSRFDLKAELLAFFDYYVAGIDNGYADEPRVRWFTTGAEQWRAAAQWPQGGGALSFCLTPDNGLARRGCGRTRDVIHVPRADAATGGLTRWNTTMGMPVAYPEHSRQDAALLHFTSAPFSTATEVTGSPVVTLAIANSAPDAAYFVYLEEVRPDGTAYYVTEGIARASHASAPIPDRGAQPYRMLVPMPSHLRADARPDTAGQMQTLTIGMLPISHRFAAGSRVRIVLAGSDTGHFAAPPIEGQRWTVRVGEHGTRISLPTVPASGATR